MKCTIRSILAAAVRVGFVFSVIAGPCSSVSAEPASTLEHQVPDTVVLDELQNLYKPVPFSHKAHADMAMMWDGCTTCHHYQPEPESDAEPTDAAPNGKHTQLESKQIPACKNCHPVAPEKGTIRIPSLKAAYHRQCLNCHRDWSNENQCVVCHEPAKAGGDLAPQPTRGDIIGRMHPPIEMQAVKVYKTRFTPAAGDNVTFRHDEHIERFGLSCNECHHRDTCRDCHHKPGEKAGPRKPLLPAASWDASHGPCMSCHVDQGCNHCHYPNGQQPPPSFEHATTGQAFDDDHKTLECKACHATHGYHKPPTCGDAGCHPSNPNIKFPDHRPGPYRKPETDKPASFIAMTPPRHPDAAEQASDKTQIPVIRDALAAPRIDPYPTTKRPAIQPRDFDLKSLDLPDDPTSCIRSGCHENRLNYNYVHGPVAAGDCGACHKLTDEADHRFQLLREKQDLCTYCHQFEVDAMPVLHDPVKTGQCLGCHDPHGGYDRSLTREQSIQQMCQRCHEPVTKDRSVQHYPVGEGRCTACHPPHASKNPKLLDKVGADLCMACHTEFEQSLNKVMFRHEALKEGCEKCHDVHGSNHPMALVQPLDRLCHQCHEKLVTQAQAATHRHDVVFEERACVTCHTPHGGDLAKLLAEPSTKTCLSCHGEPIMDGDKVLVAGMAELNNPDLFKHGPLREDSCSGCHQPHGGDLDHMLVKPYVFSLRQTFEPEHYALCFVCHEQQGIQERTTASATKFRNGETNLHYLHVTQGKRGRNCFACHNAHVSHNPKNVKSEVQYGAWAFSMNFTATETGGRCVTGCHLPYAYDRENPVPVKEETTLTASAVATNAVDDTVVQPIKVDWQGTDQHDQAVRIPTPQGRGVIVFAPTDVEQLQALVRWLMVAVPEQDMGDVILVLPEVKTTSQLDSLEPSIPGHWRIVVDAEKRLTDLMKVQSTPLVLLTDEQGNVITRIAGHSPAASLKLRTHLQWLAREHDERGKQPPAIAPLVVGDQQVGKDTWYLQSARRHIKDEQLDVAQAVLEKGLTVVPASTSLKTELAGVLIRRVQTQPALAIIDELQKQDADNPALELLRCRALVAMNQPDQALKRLTQLADHHPGPQVYFLLGQVYEKQEQWQQAVEAYRKAGEM
ncbi:tetratricopeptide repeat protein [Planctomycetales bacterium ZRK34]|nr:tetratricopeptide repeat protein [Planctomycetales bacterium ZRK34]